MSDSEINLVLNERWGFSQKLSHDDAQLLLDKLIEFEHKESFTDVSLNHFRLLGRCKHRQRIGGTTNATSS